MMNRFLLTLLAFILSSNLIAQNQVATQNATNAQQKKYFSIQKITAGDGTTFDRITIAGPPKPPPGLVRVTASMLRSNKTVGINMITEVPAFDWSFGCSPTSAAMIAGYYDRHRYGNMYTGQTNAGVMPLDNSSWPSVVINGDTNKQCPLSATQNGLDGRTTRGHVDDYWILYNAKGPDPFVTNGWEEHTLGDCTADFMKANKWIVPDPNGYNLDGATIFNFRTDNLPATPWNILVWNVENEDGGYGIKLFYESRGYTVTNMYNQYIDGHNGLSAGFTFAQYKAEIDAGRPVMIHLKGHTIVGIGYDDATNLVYLHDTWDYSTHTMTWGGTYSGLQQIGVTIVQLGVPEIDIRGNGNSITNGNTIATVTNGTDFGSVSIGSSVKHEFLIYSTGDDTLRLTGSPIAQISGSNDFTVTSQPSTTSLAPNSWTTLTIRYNPSGPSIQSATISIANNDFNENPYNFTIQGTGNTLPIIVSYTPTCNALNVAKNANIIVTFSNDIISPTLNNSTIKINGSLSGLHSATYNYSSSTNTVTITPTSPFKYGEVVTTTLTRGIKNAAGDSLTKNYTLSFTTQSNGGTGKYIQTSTPFAGINPISVKAGDFDGDGSLDLAIVNNGSSTVSILLNNGSGLFTKNSAPSVGSNPAEITSGDFNSDGSLDLAIGNNGSRTVSILLNNGSGSFTQTSILSVGGFPRSIISGDFNGDGSLDLAVVNSDSNMVSIFLNNGIGTFTKNSSLSVGSYPGSISAGDFNADGSLDLAVINQKINSYGTVSILLNNGTGTFTQTSTLSVGSYPSSITAGDFNADGSLDLAITNNNNSYGTVSILINNGSGTFTQTSTPSVGNSTTSVIAGDFNGDGSLDLAVANSNSNTVSILLNNGSGTFTQTSTPSVGSYPTSVIAGDFNGDGSLDLAVANNWSTTISILKNLSIIPDPPTGLVVTDSSRQTIAIKWRKNTESDFLRYRIYRGTSPSPTIKVDSTIGGTADTSKTFTGLVNGTRYYLRITAIDSAGNESGYSNEVNGAPADRVAPAPPQALVVTDSSSQTITIKWQKNTESDFLRYRIYRGTSSSPPIKVDSTIADTTKMFTGLTNGTRYYLRITAIDSAGNESGYSNEVNAAPADRVAPAPPHNLAVTDSSSQTITIKWRKNTESDFLRYRIYRDTSPSPTLKVDSTTGGTADTSKKFTGLTNGTRYYLRITAIDSAGNESGYSNEVNAVPTDRVAPAAPQALVVTDSSSHTIAIKWQKNTESDFLRYRIYRRTSSSPTTKVDSTTGGIADTSKTFTGLTNSTRYYFRITAVDSAGNESGYSNEVNSAPADRVAPAPPQALVVTDSSSKTITIKWRKNTESDFLRYRIYRSTSPSPTIKVDSTIADTTKIFTGLTNGTRYYLRVTAVDSAGNESGYSNEVNATTADRIAPAPPQALVVTDSSSQTIAIKWQKNTESDFLRYRIYRSTSPSSTIKVDSTTGGTADTSKTFTGLVNGTRYYLRITAIDSAGNESGYSNEVNGAPDASLSVELAALNVPTVFSLEQNYPNPFNPTTVIGYQLPKSSYVNLKIYNLLGCEIATLVNEQKSAGTYIYQWNAANRPSGLYFYRLQAGSFSETKKLILLK
ncbi:MAG: FG-GAP-like repeat-containing protein [Ignavibacteriales bacterium]|nr:FG-GAP-like repeat-containing protein [Ignavibacteriales bacterium]